MAQYHAIAAAIESGEAEPATSPHPHIHDMELPIGLIYQASSGMAC
jgi:hypothetical protein